MPHAPSLLQADSSCDGSTDCNVCAEDVRGQFAEGDWERGPDDWHFQPFQAQGDVTAGEAYDGGLHHHVQGFVRLNGPGERFAMIHSGGWSWRWGRRFASLSLIADGDGQSSLVGLRVVPAQGAHTSGLFTLGRYVGLLNRDASLALLDVTAEASGPLLEHRLPVADPRRSGLSPWSGGVAMARLAEGGYLLVANEGGNGESSGRSHFFRVQGDLAQPGAAAQLALQPLGEYLYPRPPRGPSDYHHAENLALITECGSGEIYAVHVGSSDYLYRFQRGRTFWRVSRVVIAEQSATLEPVGVYTRVATLQRCFGRAGGSAFVHADHRIELYCHEWKHVPTELPQWRFWRNRSAAPDPRSAAERSPSAL